MRYPTLIAAALVLAPTRPSRPRGGRAEHLQLGQLHQPRADEEVRAGLRRQGDDDGLRFNDTALAKVKAGAHGFDIVVPSANFMQVWIKDGLLLESRPDQMENFKHVAQRWVDVAYDPGRHYSVPWQWGVTGVSVNTDVYHGGHQYLGHSIRSTAGAGRQDQCRARDERHRRLGP